MAIREVYVVNLKSSGELRVLEQKPWKKRVFTASASAAESPWPSYGGEAIL